MTITDVLALLLSGSASVVGWLLFALSYLVKPLLVILTIVVVSTSVGAAQHFIHNYGDRMYGARVYVPGGGGQNPFDIGEGDAIKVRRDEFLSAARDRTQPGRRAFRGWWLLTGLIAIATLVASRALIRQRWPWELEASDFAVGMPAAITAGDAGGGTEGIVVEGVVNAAGQQPFVTDVVQQQQEVGGQLLAIGKGGGDVPPSVSYVSPPPGPASVSPAAANGSAIDQLRVVVTHRLAAGAAWAAERWRAGAGRHAVCSAACAAAAAAAAVPVADADGLQPVQLLLRAWWAQLAQPWRRNDDAGPPPLTADDAPPTASPLVCRASCIGAVAASVLTVEGCLLVVVLVAVVWRAIAVACCTRRWPRVGSAPASQGPLVGLYRGWLACLAACLCIRQAQLWRRKAALPGAADDVANALELTPGPTDDGTGDARWPNTPAALLVLTQVNAALRLQHQSRRPQRGRQLEPSPLQLQLVPPSPARNGDDSAAVPKATVRISGGQGYCPSLSLLETAGELQAMLDADAVAMRKRAKSVLRASDIAREMSIAGGAEVLRSTALAELEAHVAEATRSAAALPGADAGGVAAAAVNPSTSSGADGGDAAPPRAPLMSKLRALFGGPAALPAGPGHPARMGSGNVKRSATVMLHTHDDSSSAGSPVAVTPAASAAVGLGISPQSVAPMSPPPQRAASDSGTRRLEGTRALQAMHNGAATSPGLPPPPPFVVSSAAAGAASASHAGGQGMFAAEGGASRVGGTGSVTSTSDSLMSGGDHEDASGAGSSLSAAAALSHRQRVRQAARLNARMALLKEVAEASGLDASSALLTPVVQSLMLPGVLPGGPAGR